MATKTEERRASSRSRQKGGRSRSSAGRTRTASRTTKGGRGAGARSKVLSAFREHVGDRSADAYGLGMALVAVLLALGMYADAAGPVGEFLEAVARGLVGAFAHTVPPLLAGFGTAIVLDRPNREVGRVAVGSSLLGLGAIGLWHLANGAPMPAEGIKALWPAGGLIGWTVSRPLQIALSLWGATAVLAVLALLGSLIVTRTPLSALVGFVRRPGRTDADADADTATDATAPTRRARRRATTDDPAADSDGDVDDARREQVRATLAGTRFSQVELDDDTSEIPTAQTAADREAGRIPAIARPDPAATATTAIRKAAKVAPVTSWADFQLPPLDLLTSGTTLKKQSAKHIDAQVAALQETFHQFGVDAQVARWSRGPTVTRFEIELGPGVQVKKVANMGDDIAYALAAPDVRIVAPIPGKSAIGVEVPNRQRDLITIGDILRSDAAVREKHPLMVALGVDIAGNPALVNLGTMPHLLVSGATGSGKSVTLNAMITSVVMRARPDQVRMVLIDPKRVELNHYEGVPHLLSPVVTDPRRATDAVQWCVKEMERRYDILAQLGYRDITSYNTAVDADEVRDRPGPEGEPIVATRMPYILLVIDELADLMLVAPRDVEDAICRIAQMARAVGIHMVIATQRPSVDVITGLIKANIPSRLALAVASQTDSRTILDMGGAEKLVGDGDMLFLPASQGKPSRLQGCYVSEREIRAAVEFGKRQRQAEYVDVIRTGDDAERVDAARSGDDDSDEALLRRAAEQVVNSGLGSTSMLQRKLRIGFARAGRLMDELEQLGVVGPNEGSKAREVVWTIDDLDEATNRGLL